MKLLKEGKSNWDNHRPFHTAICGTRCDEIVFSILDIEAIYQGIKSESEVIRTQTKDRLEYLLMRFGPLNECPTHLNTKPCSQ